MTTRNLRLYPAFSGGHYEYHQPMIKPIKSIRRKTKSPPKTKKRTKTHRSFSSFRPRFTKRPPIPEEWQKKIYDTALYETVNKKTTKTPFASYLSNLVYNPSSVFKKLTRPASPLRSRASKSPL